MKTTHESMKKMLEKNLKLKRKIKNSLISKIKTNNSTNDTTKISLRPLSIALSLSCSIGLTAGLTACQSTTSFNNHSATIISLPQQSQIQLFDLPINPSVSQNTKARFLQALEQHLATEHKSVSSVKSRVRPFISSESIDADSQSILQTVLETYAYKAGEEQKAIIEYKAEIMYELTEEVREEDNENALLAQQDNESFVAMSEEDITDEAEYRYESEYEEKNNQSTDAKNLIGSYLKMKSKQVIHQAQKSNSSSKTDTTDSGRNDSIGREDPSQNLVENDKNVNTTDIINKIKKFDKLNDSEKMDFMLKFFYRSPEQVEAMQLYIMKPFSHQSVGHYLPVERQYKGVISYDYNSPTTQISAQLPYALDFTNKSVAVDPAVFMPIMALIKPELLSSPEILKNLNKPQTVSFSMPEKIAEMIPADVLFDALIKGIEIGFADMDEEQFTPMEISEDIYSKQLGAKRAVKIHWGAKQSGAFFGRVLKSISRDLNAHIDNNKELYAKDASSPSHKQEIEKIKHILAIWSSVEKDFQSKDIGGLMQVIEAIAPISFNQTMYYYLSSNDQLLGYQTKLSMGSELYGWTMDSVKQTQYDPESVTTSPLYALYDESFGKQAPASIDGVALFKQLADEENLQKQARYARYDYPDWEELEEETGQSDAQVETLEEAINKDASEKQLTDFEKMKEAFNTFEK